MELDLNFTLFPLSSDDGVLVLLVGSKTGGELFWELRGSSQPHSDTNTNNSIIHVRSLSLFQ